MQKNISRQKKNSYSLNLGTFGGSGLNSRMEKAFSRSTEVQAMSIGVFATNYWRSKKKPFERKKESWSCPPEGTVKSNVDDAAFDIDQGKGSLAAVARDFR
jgi:hypothetical protein